MVATFPFGWVRNINSENWQLLWNPANKDFFAKGTASKKIIKLSESDSWIEAKEFASKVLDSPADYFPPSK